VARVFQQTASPLSISGLGANGAAFGLTGGFNAQSGALVLGLEGDWTRTVLRTDTPFAANIPPLGAITGTLGTDVDWMASLRLRAGVAVGQALLYGTAGLAVARGKGELVIHGGTPVTWTDRALLAGWTIGAGIEYALTPSWSVKGEVIRTQLGDSFFSSATDKVPVSSRVDIYNLRGGLNFRF
jgi:outer membrane immunogenic protein